MGEHVVGHEVLDETEQEDSAVLLLSPSLLVAYVLIREGRDLLLLSATEHRELWLPVGGYECCGQ